MKKLIIVPLMLAAMFALAGGASASQPAPGPTEPEWGACRWYCNDGRSSSTRAACEAVCPGECEQIC